MPALTCVNLGRAAYSPVLTLQRSLVAKVQAVGGADAVLLLVEHDPPVITLGRRGRREDILASPDQLAAARVEVYESTRGGEVTYHGPGELVAYPILHLRAHDLTLRRYVTALEETVVGALGRFGVAGRRRDGRPGVWVGEAKIASIGVAVERWVTYHGVALNVSPDLGRFGWIVPCGQADMASTSIRQTTEREIDVSRATCELVECFAEVFGFDEIRHENATPS